MTIEDAEQYVRNLWDWAILRGCFGDSSIQPTDVDGLVEHRGQFLLLETKAPTTDITDGQRWTFEALLRTGYFTIVIIYGQQNTPERLHVWTQKRRFRYDLANLETLRNVIAWWYDQVHRL